jgi:peroxin-14
MGGVSYAVYWTARRYIYPLIAPPTPPQLEQDKAHIDASFEKTFTLLDQLATDTQELKDAEAARKERLDRALGEVESVISKMKEANENREYEAKRWGREMEEVKEQIPLAIQREKEGMEGRLKDLAAEMKSLKTLVGNRMGQSQRPSFGTQAGGVNGVNAPSAAAVGAPPTPTPQAEVNGGGVAGSAPSGSVVVEDGEKQGQRSSSALPDRSGAGSPYSSRLLGGKPQIPDWQLAAKKRKEEAAAKESAVNGSTAQDVSESGTAAPAEADAGP